MVDTNEIAKAIRRLSLEIVHASGGSHIGSALSIADILATLYGSVLKVDPTNPQSADRDRFVLSKGHACSALYSALMLKGFFSETELRTYGHDGSVFMNHASHKVPGVEFSTGALGHGLPFATGLALAAKVQNANHQVFVLISDGELAEGSNWEAMLLASHQGLSNLTVIMDYNNLQSLDTVSNTLAIEPIADKFEAFNFQVQTIDGHDHSALIDAFTKATEQPNLVICKTVKGKGVDFMENSVKWHYSNTNEEELSNALNQL